jgi:hypothetical protein
MLLCDIVSQFKINAILLTDTTIPLLIAQNPAAETLTLFEFS